jgi:hypothetical protein
MLSAISAELFHYESCDSVLTRREFATDGDAPQLAAAELFLYERDSCRVYAGKE